MLKAGTRPRPPSSLPDATPDPLSVLAADPDPEGAVVNEEEEDRDGGCERERDDDTDDSPDDEDALVEVVVDAVTERRPSFLRDRRPFDEAGGTYIYTPAI